MPTDAKSQPVDYTHRVLFLRLGETIANYYALRFPDPFERPTTATDPTKLFASINEQTVKLRVLIAEYSSFAPLRHSLGIHSKTLLKSEIIQILSLVAFFDHVRGEQAVESITNHLATIISEDQLEGKLRSRKILAALLERGALMMKDSLLHTGMMARGLKMIVGALVEDVVFNEAKGEVTFGIGEVKQAIERVVSVDGERPQVVV